MIKHLISVTSASRAASSIAALLICFFAFGFNSSAKAQGEIALVSNEVESSLRDSSSQIVQVPTSQVTEPGSKKKEPRKQEENKEDNPQLIIEQVTQNGEFIDITSQEKVKEDDTKAGEAEKIWESVEITPEFPGGEAAMYKFISDNIIYPEDAAKDYVQGAVVVRFVIEKDGSVSNVEVASGKHPSLDKEAVRVTQSLPNFIPGKQKGQPVRVRYVIPVIFRIK